MTSAPRILSISSDSSVFETRNQVLVSAGFEVVGCFRGEGALEAFTRQAVDAVVIGDSLSPEGRRVLLEAFRKLRPNIPVVVIRRSGAAEEDLDATAVIESLDGPQRLIRVLQSLLISSPERSKSLAE